MKNLNGRPNNIHENENAITLVALIITIIILIILAAVTINSLTHDGLADMAIKGAQDYDKAQQNEMNMLNEIDSMVKETIKNIEDGTTKPKPDPEPEPPTPSNPWDKDDLDEVKVKDENGNDVSIPKPEDSTILNPDATVDEGIVMKDTNNNEWVWVPVDSATYNSMFAENSSGIALSGSTGVKTTKYSTSASLIGQTQTLPGTTGYREPDLVTSYDNDANAKTAGFSNLNDMATKLVEDYNKMADSIKKYGGFYIGRYELTANGSKAGAPLTNTNWYNLYKKCKELTVDENKGMARMIWRMPVGCNMFVAKKFRI